MRVPDEKIEEIRRAADIVDVISGTVALKKRGKNFIGLCPFHQEKTPSFSVSPEKQMFYCFGCGKGGNVFTFIMEHERVSFIEAVRTLADRLGILLPAEGGMDEAQATEAEQLYGVCRAAGLHFYENLTSTVEGSLAREYFLHRGFTEATIRKFGLGYSMHGWDDLVRLATRQGLDLALLDKAGLVVRRDDGSGYYDRFRGRAMFPIFSTTGRTTAFGARKLRDDDPLAKYINSPETPIYNKSRTLYGLFQARDAIRDRQVAVLVEGYADLITAFQGGIENIVASSGTALTPEQIQLLGRYTRTVILVYDADSAGSKATIRGVDLVIEQDLDVRIAELPQGEDPDSFVRKFGAPAFSKLVDGAVSFLDFKAGLFQREGLLATPEGKARAIRSIVETLARMGDELKRTFYIQHLAAAYGIYESILYRELEKILGKQEQSRRAELRRPPAGAAGGAVRAAEPAPPDAAVSVAERSILKVLLEGGEEAARFIFAHITLEMFPSLQARELARRILAYLERTKAWDAGRFVDTLEESSLRQLVSDLLVARYDISKAWEAYGTRPPEPDIWKIARDAISILRVRELDAKISQTYDDLRRAESRGEDVTVFQQKIHQLQVEKRGVAGMWEEGAHDGGPQQA
jgi:DNA primase